MGILNDLGLDGLSATLIGLGILFVLVLFAGATRERPYHGVGRG